MLSKIPKDVLETGAIWISINSHLETTYVIKDQNSIIWYH